jgi:sugar/nucleoside kinase (ribokinase family)
MDLVRLNKLIKMATKSKVGVFLDFPNQQEKFDKSNLKNVDFSVPNRHEAELLLGTKIMTITDALKAASKLKGFTNGNVVITLDRDGCVIVDKKNSVPKHISTKNVKVVDTTGSGDIFRGILLVEYLKTGSLEKAAQKAVSFATKTCLVSGVDASIRYSQKNQ